MICKLIYRPFFINRIRLILKTKKYENLIILLKNLHLLRHFLVNKRLKITIYVKYFFTY